MSRTTPFLLVAALSLAACATSEDPIQITIHGPNGADAHVLTPEELAATVGKPVPAYRVDGVTTTDPSRILEGA
jgi:hypothetical protein